MKIGIISTIGSGYIWAGSEEMWFGMAQAAIANGHGIAIHVANQILESTQVAKLQHHSAACHRRMDVGLITRRLIGKGLSSRYRKFFAEGLDVLCISMGGIADCIWSPDLLRELEKSLVPYVVIVQANAEGIVEQEQQREKLRDFYEKAAGVIFVSEHNYRLAERQIAQEFSNSHIILNPLRIPVPEPSDWPDESTFKIAEVARLEVVDKQQDHLLEALSADQWRSRNWELTFYGSGPDEGHIKRLIDFYGLAGKAKIGGFVNDFRDIWKQNHLHILPSRREGMPLSLIESMACGRAAIVTRAGGSPELVEEGVNGWVCPGMHPEVLSNTLETAWLNRENWHSMGFNARQLINKKINENWAQDVLQIVVNAASKVRCS